MADWESHINHEIDKRQQQLSSLDGTDKRRAENEIARLEKQKQKMAMQKAITERRFNQQKGSNDPRLKQPKNRD
jgi:septal ring factor EnvC (AmiA/AmiB activator)